MSFENFFQSKIFKWILCGVGAAAVLLIVFQAGMYVGFRKANFSYKWGENYRRNFGGPRGGFFGDLRGKSFIGANGAAGQIIKIDGRRLTVKDLGSVEKIVILKEDTTINRFREAVKPADLKINDYIVVIGAPNDSGQIEAKLIRLMPEPPQGRPSFAPPFFKKENFKR